MTYAGIDGCKKGWALMLYQDEKLSFGGIYETIDELMAASPVLDRLFIDMPMGLSSAGHLRTLESHVRQELKGRSSTVFNTPAREAIYAGNYTDASQINERIEGKKLSKQTYNITAKIRELDEFLTAQESIDQYIESHPELCFKYLNDGKVLMTSKSDHEGGEERLKILELFDRDVRNVYNKALASTLRKDVKCDDLIDALCLCIANKLCGSNTSLWIKDDLISDAKGIPMRIGFYKG